MIDRHQKACEGHLPVLYASLTQTRQSTDSAVLQTRNPPQGIANHLNHDRHQKACEGNLDCADREKYHGLHKCIYYAQNLEDDKDQ